MSNWLRTLTLALVLATPLMALDYSESSSTVNAATNEWEDFKYEEMGLSQWEFQQVRDAGMSKEKLLSLLELGVRPSEYLQKPWESLGVTEDQWLAERGKGMDDSDIDRSYRNKSVNQDYAYWSILVPSLYQWKTGKTTNAITMDALWALSVGATVYLAVNTEPPDELYMVPFILGVHVWSFAEGFLETRWENNPDANRFSWGILPTPNGGWVGALGVSF